MSTWPPDEQTEDVKNVAVTTFWREDSNSEYKQQDRPHEGITLIDVSQTLGWFFTGSDFSLDTVVVDGTAYNTWDVINATTMKSTGVKEGSTVLGYKTGLGN